MCVDTANCLATLEHQTRAIREGSALNQYTLSAMTCEVLGDVCLCVACEEMLRKRLERAQRRHWADLPRIFDLHIPGWGDRVGETVAVTDNGSYGEDDAPEDAERTDDEEPTQNTGSGDADKGTTYEGVLDEEQTDAETYTSEHFDQGGPEDEGGSEVHSSDGEREHLYPKDEETWDEEAVESQTSDDSLFGLPNTP